MWHGLRPTSILSGILIHPTVWPQYINVTDRHDRQRSDRIGRAVLQTIVQNATQPWTTANFCLLFVLLLLGHLALFCPRQLKLFLSAYFFNNSQLQHTIDSTSTQRVFKRLTDEVAVSECVTGCCSCSVISHPWSGGPRLS